MYVCMYEEENKESARKERKQETHRLVMYKKYDDPLLWMNGFTAPEGLSIQRSKDLCKTHRISNCGPVFTHFSFPAASPRPRRLPPAVAAAADLLRSTAAICDHNLSDGFDEVRLCIETLFDEGGNSDFLGKILVCHIQFVQGFDVVTCESDRHDEDMFSTATTQSLDGITHLRTQPGEWIDLPLPCQMIMELLD